MKIQHDVITSRNNGFVKWAASLSEKKGRERESCFIAEGIKLTVEALSCALPVSHIIVDENNEKEILDRLNDFISDSVFANTQLVKVSGSVFEKISTEKAPQGVICVIKNLDFFHNIDIINKEDFFLGENERGIVLSSVRDPANLGSVIRSAVAFGTEHVILSGDCADIYNPRTVRSAMGSLFKIKMTRVKNLSNFISVAKESGRRVFSAELNENALSLDSETLLPTDLIVIGNEGHGVSSDISKCCTNSIYIPISQNTESLNASVAAAIFMWEQRKK